METDKDGYLPVIRRDFDSNSYRLDNVAFMDKQKLRLCLSSEETQLSIIHSLFSLFGQGIHVKRARHRIFVGSIVGINQGVVAVHDDPNLRQISCLRQS
jgi:hypothetical protein